MVWEEGCELAWSPEADKGHCASEPCAVWLLLRRGSGTVDTLLTRAIICWDDEFGKAGWS